MQTVSRALDWGGSVVPTESTDDARVDAVAISDLHVVVTTRGVKFHTQHHKPVRGRTLTEHLTNKLNRVEHIYIYIWVFLFFFYLFIYLFFNVTKTTFAHWKLSVMLQSSDPLYGYAGV